jgi:hypothetical protein
MKHLILLLLLLITFPLFSDYNARAIIIPTYRYVDSEDDIIAGYIELRVGAEKLVLAQTLLSGLSTLVMEQYDENIYTFYFLSSFRFKENDEHRILDHDYDVKFDKSIDCVEVDVHQKTEILLYEAKPDSYGWNLLGDLMDGWD